MLRDLGYACLSPFRFPLAALLATLLLVGAPLGLVVGGGMVNQLTLLGTTFFDPERGGDPLALQHFIWFVGHPETIRLATILSVLIFGPLAYATWWRAREQIKGRLRFAAVARLAVWLWLALSVLLLNGVYFALVPVAVAAADIAVLALLSLVALALLARFQPRIAAALGGADQMAPGWGRAFAMGVLILLLGLLFQIAGLLAWVGMTDLGSSAYGTPEPGLPRWVLAVLVLDWQQIFAFLAFAYTSLIAVDFLRRQADPVRINRQ